MTSEPTQSPLDIEDVRARVDTSVDEFLAARGAQLAQISPNLNEVTSALQDFMKSGKRIRPIFCWWAWRGCGGANDDSALRAAASLEFIQACALIHDDMMDKSDTRRGQPAVHRRFESLHNTSDWFGSAQAFGEASAILVGDLALAWADQAYYESGLDPERLSRGKPVYDNMRTEVVAGQYLDVLQQAQRSHDRAEILRVAQFKTAKYTIERPLHLGAVWVDAPESTVSALSDFGLPLGVAFQIRDDIMGVFGDPEQTGKPAGDDVREGKYTFLIDYAYAANNPATNALLDRSLGNPDLTAEDVDEVRASIRETGALDRAEQEVEEHLTEALTALDRADLDPQAAGVLAQLAQAAAHRAQ
ncbi:MAG: polyprenyl synthetase family protein [Candidatus Nanopelagicales bacterium]